MRHGVLCCGVGHAGFGHCSVTIRISSALRVTQSAHGTLIWIEATVLHNQARGTHSVDDTQALVGSLVEAGVPLDQVALALHMDADELLRYRQRDGRLDQIDGTYSKAWE